MPENDYKLTCLLCGMTPAALPWRPTTELVRLQEHAMEEHGVTREDLVHTKRSFLHFGPLVCRLRVGAARWPALAARYEKGEHTC